MARMDTFEDNFEGIATGNIVSMHLLPLLDENFNWDPTQSTEAININKNTARQHLRKAKKQLLGVQFRNYVCCWYLADRESVAMWDLYSNEDGLAIQVDRKVIQDQVKKQIKTTNVPHSTYRVLAGKVQYHDFRQVAGDQESHKMKYLSYRKDISFAHEREYRFVITVREPVSCDRFDYNLGDLQEMNPRIIASPRMSGKNFLEIQGKLHEINPNFKVQESELRPWYRFTSMDI